MMFRAACLLWLLIASVNSQEIDHAGVIRAWDADSLTRGEKIYQTICITCHGTPEKEGTLPTSRKFWEAEFRNGEDPYAMFRTLSDGFEQMPAFPFLSPKQRYDVIHFMREKLVRPNNPSQYFEVESSYLSSLPKGVGDGSSDVAAERFDQPPYLRMNFGPALHWTFEVEPGNIAYKGIAIRLDGGAGGVSKGRAWMLYDHDTMRVAAAWTGEEFVDWRGIAFDGSHGTHTSIVGEKAFVNPVGPGWAEPGTDDWEDRRFRGRDGKPYGPLTHDHAQFKGSYQYGDRVVLEYTVGETLITESPGLERMGETEVFTRSLNIGPTSEILRMRIAPSEVACGLVAVGIDGVGIESDGGFHVLRIDKSDQERVLKVWISDGTVEPVGALPPAELLSPYMSGGPPKWEQSVLADIIPSDEESAYVVDTFEVPNDEANPWNSWMRLGGFDFDASGDRAYVCTWLGDVWTVDGISQSQGSLRWRRIASGLFQPLGLKLRDGRLFVSCRDQIVELIDLNGDEEIDWYRTFNRDHQVTEHFHEFAMGLQTDDDGNFYYAKSARHALPALVAHHGTLLKVAADGSETEILATGFRAANGVCLNDDGSFYVTDQEGHWTPKNRINRVVPGGFYGNMMGYHDVTDESDNAMEQPVVWITNSKDRSPGELIRVPQGGKWGPLGGALLNLSYGTGNIYAVLTEMLDGSEQGGVVELPIPRFPTGVMRGRFHPLDGQLYACGMFAWAGNQQEDGGFYRVRYGGGSAHMPVSLSVKKNGLELTFTDRLAREHAKRIGNYRIRAWSLRRSSRYGSDHVDEHSIPVKSALVSSDGLKVFLDTPDLEQTRGMSIALDLIGEDGVELEREIHNTIHHVPEQTGPSWLEE